MLSLKISVSGRPSAARSVPDTTGPALAPVDGVVFCAAAGRGVGEGCCFVLVPRLVAAGEDAGRSREASYARAMRSASGTSSISSRSKHEMLTSAEPPSAAPSEAAGVAIENCNGEACRLRLAVGGSPRRARCSDGGLCLGCVARGFGDAHSAQVSNCSALSGRNFSVGLVAAIHRVWFLNRQCDLETTAFGSQFQGAAVRWADKTITCVTSSRQG